ncbi:probable chitinase 2 [Helicoverpa zea]|uniref:probable chitinase 2 n=1 Tax=Helicoverpa zea TaxID=7113 RepID=UPI001F57CAD6|nr:probable chitinase 2 [Helicoverpa zea]
MLAVNVCVLFVLALSHIVASENAVICYYGTWATYRTGLGKYDVTDINPNLCTHLIYAFVGIDSEGNIISLDPYLDLPDDYGRDNFGKFNALKQQNPSLKTLVAVGGWNEGSAKYSVMANNSTLRQNFIDSALKMITTHGFDGLDIDWEYPNRRDTVYGEADIENFTTLLKEIREVFDKKGLLLTAAVSSVRASASQSYDVKAISEYLDIVNIMTYDMYGAWDSVTGHNAPLHKGEGDEDAVAEDLYTVDQALYYWISEGCPPEKIAVGVPFYGRTFTLTSANETGVRAPASGAGIAGPYTATEGFVGYNEFCNILQTEEWTQNFDSLAKVPYAFKDTNWVSYDNVNSITAKVEFAKSLGITKIMMWSIETDDFHNVCGNGANPLLTAINTALGTESDDNITTTTVSDATVASSTTESSTTVASSTTESTTTVASSTTESTTIESSTESTVAPSSACTVEGYIQKPGDCSSFLYCLKDVSGNLVPKEFKCPATLYWDQTILACNYQAFVECN